jgi:crossover junction endodeoxyribonuclease RuvC
MTSKILGIDPGTATTGYAILQGTELLDFGIIKTEKTDSAPERLRQICTDIKSICKKYKPDCCAIEELFFVKNIKTGIAVAQARGAIIATVATLGIEIAEYKPVEIKSAITGNGQAEKSQVQKMVQIILGLKEIPQPDDAADAIAIALTHQGHSKAF